MIARPDPLLQGVVATVMCVGTCTKGTAALAFAAAKGAFIGSTTMGALGGYSAAVNGGDISQGLMFGTAVGAVAGGIGGYVNAAVHAPALELLATNAGTFWGDLGLYAGSNLAAGSFLNAASGATVGYSGGAGNLNNILQGGLSAARNGLGVEGALTALGFAWAQSTGGPLYESVHTERTVVIDDLGQQRDWSLAVSYSFSIPKELVEAGKFIQTIAASTASPEYFVDKSSIRKVFRGG